MEIVRDRMIDVPQVVEGAELDPGLIEANDRLGGEAERSDITLLILPDPFGIGGAGRVQRGILRHLTGNALIGRRAGEVETSLDVGRNPVSEIEIAAYGIHIAMVAIDVDPMRRKSGKIIERPGNTRGGALSHHIATRAKLPQ